ncbi:uncharacterized protein LOC131841376 [Achroia grisella]|uniref:uncharacterized protein LOC131841376 n=1 Tax=Achroia grisella TaxID=688607 RepID=UPI0027D2E3CD|nr:uncharacterized protein LOC131841376 [Achroia grisella]
MPLGKIESFEIGSHNWDTYCRRIRQYMTLNGIATELHVATLVTHVGVECYELMCDLCAPDLPEMKTFEELERIVKEHLEPQRSEIAERHVFRQRKQGQGETINEYLQNLKHLAKTCNFGGTLEINLRDQFVSGLYHEDMRSRLFAERELNYKRAVELALALEAADRHAATAASGMSSAASGSTSAAAASEGLHRVARARGPRTTAAGGGGAPGTATGRGGGGGGGGGGDLHRGDTRRAGPCPRCGRDGHAAAKCRFKMYRCDRCGEKGHLKSVCKHSQRDKSQFFLNESNSDSEIDLDFFNLSCSGKDAPYYVSVKVENCKIKFEIDTGSKISAISKVCYDKLFSHLTLINQSLRLKSYTGNIIKPLGYILVNVIHDKFSDKLQLFVFENGGPPLLGRTWIRRLQLNTLECHNNIAEVNHNSIVKMLRVEFPEVFADGLGTYNKSCIQLHLTDKTPVFVKARPLPLALREPVERELERLKRDDVIYKVERSDYGTPIVPIVKKNGSIRICGDYKITLNPLLKDFHYPLPRVEDIFANLAGGEQYSKLDLSHAYQQALLSEESQPMTAITTHIGTFVYKRVPFGLKCIPENFQKLIEEILSGLPSVVAFQDDICVTGVDRCEQAFMEIKNTLSKSPVLAHYNAKLPLVLSVDSSAYGLGAVLAHKYTDGSERPISCASRTLNEAERNSQIDKEALAIVFGVTKHHQYIYGRRFIIRSDHRALSYIFGKNKGIPQTAASRLQRYAVRLAAYNFDIEFVPSNKNCVADALSRLPLEYTKQVYEQDCYSYLNFVEDKLRLHLIR